MESYLTEASLETLLENHPELIGIEETDPSAGGLVPIGRQVTLGGGILDLLFIDASGKLTAVEAKLERNSEIRRQVVAQILEYAAYLTTWEVEDVERQASRYLSSTQPHSSQSMYDAVAKSLTSEASPSQDVAELREAIATNLRNSNLRLIVAVDRIVDSLRTLVAFINNASRFDLYLLEVQQYRAADGPRIASIDLFGGHVKSLARPNGSRLAWDQPKFIEALESADATSKPVIQDLLAFINERADIPNMGQGSVHFGVRRKNGKRFNLFYITVIGEVWVSGAISPERLPLEFRRDFLSHLRAWAIPKTGDDVLASGSWVLFQGSVLADPARLSQFKEDILRAKELTD
jgi:hypothetical protein